MTVRLHSYVSFNGNAKEATEFYQTIFGGNVYTDTFEHYASDDMPVADADKHKIMHGFVKGDDGIELMVSDVTSGMEFDESSRITLSLSGDDEEKLRGYWEKLSAEGTVTLPLAKAPWGDTFGMVTDKFGVNWMVDIGKVE